MRLTPRHFAGLAILSLALSGCGGNSGTQTTSSPIRSFKVAAATVYGADAPAVGTVDDADTTARASRAAVAVIPLATLTSDQGQTVVLWGTRDEAGKVSSVREAAYQDGDVTLYARYGADGGILSVLGAGAGTSNDPSLAKNAGSYVTFGPLEAPGLNSITGSGIVFENGTQTEDESVRATLTDNGVTVTELDGKSQVVRLDPFVKTRAARAETDPLDGFASVYQEPENRTKIVTSLLKVAGVVVEKPYSTYISNSSAFLFLDRLSQSYSNYTAQGFDPTTAGEATTPLPYRSDLP
ncbi:hypothetical protein EON79_19215 [bacterium]|nr:MAG: hypothetical protein EON79_19215 [bacterium]